VESLKPAAEGKQLELTSSLDPAAGPVLADAPRLQQVVSNLLGNAIKFTPAGGRVELTLRRREPMVEICVMDTGKGIPATFLPHVFDAFSQADAGTTRAHRGLGLGLAISRRLVEMHGGRIEAKSEGEGRGATFKVLLPALVQAELWPASMKSRAGLAAAAGQFEGLRVLVVEDDVDARDLLEEVLCSAGCSVTASSSVGDALTALQSEHPDILLSDIAMPGETGFDLIRRVRALPPENGGSIPAAALTAYASAEDRRRVLQAGFMMHVPKPVDPDELLQAVSVLVRHAHQPQPSS
ncbi:MAG TPA: ATP-binding protein, partial [Polyangiaceae bacterium]|nr:ATP-binding protein [Polyangiaceae bacterium]